MPWNADHLLAAALLQQCVQQQPVFVVCHPPPVVALSCGVPNSSKRYLQVCSMLKDTPGGLCRRHLLEQLRQPDCHASGLKHAAADATSTGKLSDKSAGDKMQPSESSS